MTGTQALQSVQFVTVKGKRLAVLTAEDWEALVEWLETLEDVQVAQQAFDQLQAAGGDRKKAGWLEWDEADKELSDECIGCYSNQARGAPVYRSAAAG
jgi:hypothetical protein